MEGRGWPGEFASLRACLCIATMATVVRHVSAWERSGKVIRKELLANPVAVQIGLTGRCMGDLRCFNEKRAEVIDM